MKTQRSIDPEHVYAGFAEEWNIMGKCDRTKGVS